jgi:hypothetical protein
LSFRPSIDLFGFRRKKEEEKRKSAKKTFQGLLNGMRARHWKNKNLSPNPYLFFFPFPNGIP